MLFGIISLELPFLSAASSFHYSFLPDQSPGGQIANMDKIPKYNVVHKLEKRRLLIAINCLAGLSIFFFGYDQGASCHCQYHRSGRSLLTH